MSIIKKTASTLTLIFSLLLLSGSTAFASSWTNSGTMNVARTQHTATLLGSGKVLIVGNIGLQSTSELWNSGSWSLSGNVHDARYGHIAQLVTISGGASRVMIAGGFDNNGATATTELFNESTGTWATATSMNHVRADFPSVEQSDGTVLVFGGTNQFNTSLNTVEKYDPVNNTWTDEATMSAGRKFETATLLNDGKILVTGGTNSSGTALQTTEVYDPSNNTWTSKASMNHARTDHAAILLPNNKVLVVGGNGSIGTAEIYDPSNDTWTNTATLNYSHQDDTLTTVTSGGNTYILAIGYTGTDYSKAELYDYVNDAWNITTSLNTARHYHTATLLGNGTVLVTGGQNSGGTTSTAEYYTP